MDIYDVWRKGKTAENPENSRETGSVRDLEKTRILKIQINWRKFFKGQHKWLRL